MDRYPELKGLFKAYFDRHGLLVQSDRDGGDTACEHFGALALCKWLWFDEFFDGSNIDDAYENSAKKLIHKHSGLWRRHPPSITGKPEIDDWAGYWWYGTRDNGTTALICTIVFGDFQREKVLYEGCQRRYWLAGNVLPRNIWPFEKEHKKYGASWRQPHDPTPRFPDLVIMWKSFFNRSCNKKWSTRLTLWFWDLLSCLFPIVHIRFNMFRGVSNGNHLNAVIRAIFCYRVFPTLVSRLAYYLINKALVKDLLKEFPPRGKNPPMAQLVYEYFNVEKPSL